MTGPLSPEGLDRARAYWQSAEINSSADAPLVDPAASVYGSPVAPALPATPVEALPDAPGTNSADDAYRPGPNTPPQPPYAGSGVAYAMPDTVPADAAPAAPVDEVVSSPGVIPANAPRLNAQGGVTAPGGAQGGPGGSSMGNLIRAKGDTYRDQADAMGRRSDYEAEQSDIMAGAKAKQAKDLRDAAEDQRIHDETFQRTIDEYTAKSQAIADAIATKKIDASRSYSDSGAGALAVVGGLLGGLYQGVNKMATNPFIDQMNKVIDRDIAIQEKELANQKDMLADRRNGLGQMIAHFKDKRLAKAEYKKMLMTAAWNDAEARAAGFDSDIIKARVEEQRAPFERAIVDLGIEELRKQQALAAAGAAARASAAERARKAALDERKVRVEEFNAETARKKAEHEGKGLNPQQEKTMGAFADAFSKPDYLMAKALLDDIDAKSTNPDGSKGDIKGMGRLADAREALAPPVKWYENAAAVIPGVGLSYVLNRHASNAVAGLSPDELNSRRQYAMAMLISKHDLTGAAAPTAEQIKIAEAQVGNKTQEELRGFVEDARRKIKMYEENTAKRDPELAKRYFGGAAAAREAIPRPIDRRNVE